MITYERVLSYGNIFPLKITCDTNKLLQEIRGFKFAQYNTKKPDIPRYGLSITSLDGELNGIDLESLNGSEYSERSFRKLTEVYHASQEVRKVIDPFKHWMGRAHLLNIRKGGYFPPHRDEMSAEQLSFRVIVPVKAFNPPHNYFIVNDQIVQMDEGRAYFVNTNLVHSDMSFSNDTTMMVLNIDACTESYVQLLTHVYSL